MANFMISFATRGDADPVSRRALAIVERICQRLWLWHERKRQRVALASLDARLLDDVGITGEQAQQEAEKPFWL